MEMIYVFGDSHRSFFTDTHPGSSSPGKKGIFVSYTLGPGTAHNFYENRHAEMMKILNNTNLSDDCGVVIVAGEIDCRLHIPKIHLETGERIPELVEDTVNRFMKSILEVKELGYKVIAWGPHPTRHLETLKYSKEWYYGDQRMRNQTCWAFNEVLYKCAIKNNIPFCTTFYNLLREYDTYTVYDEAYIDPLHLNQVLWSATERTLGQIYDNYTNFQ